MALHLEIVTPRGSVVVEDATEVIMPGKLGEFGVLDGHIPFLSALRPGVLRYRDADGKPKRMALSTGFAEVGASEKVLVLTDNATYADDVDVGSVQQELEELEHELQQWEGELTAEHRELQEKADWARARIDVVKAPSD